MSRLFPLPFGIIPTADGVVLKRGATEISILGEEAAAFVETLVSAAAGGATREEICQGFPPPERPLADELVGQLVAARLLVERDAPADPESGLDVFYWQFGESARAVTERLDRAGLVVVGVNAISRHLVQSLAAAGVTAITLVDDERLRDRPGDPPQGEGPAAIDAAQWTAGEVGCLIATSAHGDQQALRAWNARAIERGHPFVPVLLQNFIGYVGPVVFPGETACFDCLRARWNAHAEPGEVRGALDAIAIEDRDVIGFHPAMAAVLGHIAAFELTKLWGRGLPNRRIGVQIEINLLGPRLTTRRVLKVPRCPTCSPLNTRAATAARV